MRKFNKVEIDIQAKKLADRYVAMCGVNNAVKITHLAWKLVVKMKKKQNKA